ncbi:MAG: VOC family protein [Thermomicrobiales bacterium]
MTTTPRFSFVLEYVPDVVAAKAFYTDILGLKVTRESPEFVQFADANGVGWAIASDASLSGENRPETYWEVADAAALADALRKQATISHPLEQRPFGHVFGVTDPAGETQYFVEFAQRRPSTAVE